MKELGFVGVNWNPNPPAGWWEGLPLTDTSWYPILREDGRTRRARHDSRVERVATSNFHATGAYYLNADTTAFMQLIQGDLFSDFPDLRLPYFPRRRCRARTTGDDTEVSLTCWVEPTARRTRDEGTFSSTPAFTTSLASTFSLR